MLSMGQRDAAPGLYRRWGISPRLWLIPLVIALGALTGLTIARGWIYCLGFCLLCLLLLRPVETGLGAFVFFLPFEEVSAIGSQSTGTSVEWVLGLLAAGAVLGTMVVRGRFQRPSGSALWWTVFALWATASSAWAINPELVFRRLPTIFSLLVLYLICASTRFEERELKVVALLSIAGGCAAALYTTLLLHAGATIGNAISRNSMVWGDRAADPNDLALSLLLPLALSLGGFLFMRKGYARTMMLMAFALISYAVLLTLSRGALVSLLVMMIVFVRYMPRSLRRRLLIPLSMFGAAVLAMSAIILTRLALGINTGGAGRLDIWTAGLQAIKEHGLFGAGLDNFPLAYNQVAGFASQYRGMARAAHNIFLNVWVELGLPGLLLFIGAMRSHLKQASRALRERRDQFSAPILICHAACWSVITAGLFLDIVWRKTFWLSWTFLILAIKFRQVYVERTYQQYVHPFPQSYPQGI